MMANHCTVCGNEVSADAHFCGYCGVALENDPTLKNKNENLVLPHSRSQSRFLAVLSIALIALVLGVYLFRNAVPAQLETPDSRTESPRIAGRWVGMAFKDDGLAYYYAVELYMDDGEVRGTAITEAQDGSASADAQIIGTYTDGRLNFVEYGGGESGEWEDSDMCFWEFDLEFTRVDGEDNLSGTFEAVDCDSSGTVSLGRNE
jgi:hypothetical protein